MDELNYSVPAAVGRRIASSFPRPCASVLALMATACNAPTSRVYAFDRAGSTLDYLDLSERVPTGGLMGITLDAIGRIYLVDVANNRVLEISARM